jgi:hypothetical protein
MTCAQCQGIGKISVPYPPPCRGSHIEPCPCQYDAILAQAMRVPQMQELVERFTELARENYAEVSGNYADGLDGMFEHDYQIVKPFLPYRW